MGGIGWVELGWNGMDLNLNRIGGPVDGFGRVEKAGVNPVVGKLIGHLEGGDPINSRVGVEVWG